MKYLKLFEEIDYDDFDWEEEDLDDNIKVGDYVNLVRTKDSVFYGLVLCDSKRRDKNHIKVIDIKNNTRYGTLIELDNRMWYVKDSLEKDINESIDFDEEDFDWIEEEIEPNKYYFVRPFDEENLGHIYIMSDKDLFFKDYRSVLLRTIESMVKLTDYEINRVERENFDIIIWEDGGMWKRYTYDELVVKYPELKGLL